MAYGQTITTTAITIDDVSSIDDQLGVNDNCKKDWNQINPILNFFLFVLNFIIIINLSKGLLFHTNYKCIRHIFLNINFFFLQKKERYLYMIGCVYLHKASVLCHFTSSTPFVCPDMNRYSFNQLLFYLRANSNYNTKQKVFRNQRFFFFHFSQ